MPSLVFVLSSDEKGLESEKTILCPRVGTKEEMEWVIRRQTWHFDGHLFVIAPLTGSEQPSSIVINHASFWVRAYDLPINCLNNRMAKVLASKMGKYEEMDESVDDYVGNYLRFKEEIDIREPWVQSETLRKSVLGRPQV